MRPTLPSTSRARGPLAAWLSIVALAACGGGSSSSPVRAAATESAMAVVAEARDETLETHEDLSQSPRRLFAPDVAHATIGAISTLRPGAGEALDEVAVKVPDAVGNNLQIDAARDELYSLAGHRVAVFGSSSLLQSGATPLRSFALPTRLHAPHTLYLDATNDVLYVGGDTDGGNGEIVAYKAAHTLKGTSLPSRPDRSMFVDGGVSFFTLDTLRERMYVLNAMAGVHVYANAATATGQLSATATIPVLGTGLAIDSARDRLYVADLFAGLILVDQASAPEPVVTTTVPIDDARYVSIDSANDRAYVSALGNLYVLDNASELTSAMTLPSPAYDRLASASLGAVAFH